MRGPTGSSLSHHTTDVEEIVGDHTEPDPAVHSVVVLVSATIETVSPLHHADTPLRYAALGLALVQNGWRALTAAA
jgi:hypothetical protein